MHTIGSVSTRNHFVSCNSVMGKFWKISAFNNNGDMKKTHKLCFMHNDCNPRHFLSAMERVQKTAYVLTSNGIDVYVISKASGGFKWRKRSAFYDNEDFLSCSNRSPLLDPILTTCIKFKISSSTSVKSIWKIPSHLCPNFCKSLLLLYSSRSILFRSLTFPNLLQVPLIATSVNWLL
jgi:hypothetical protein